MVGRKDPQILRQPQLAAEREKWASAATDFSSLSRGNAGINLLALSRTFIDDGG